MEPDDLTYALEDAAEGSITTEYPWTDAMLAVLERVAEAGAFTDADRSELERLLGEQEVADDIADAESNV